MATASATDLMVKIVIHALKTAEVVCGDVSCAYAIRQITGRGVPLGHLRAVTN